MNFLPMFFLGGSIKLFLSLSRTWKTHIQSIKICSRDIMFKSLLWHVYYLQKDQLLQALHKVCIDDVEHVYK